jgi:FkbM family methyltransferase
MDRHDRSFWIFENQKLSYVDLEQRWVETGGDYQSGIAYQYFEMFHCPYYNDTDCDYERQECLIREGDTVLDIGGNIGIFSRRAWERGASRIIAFEPQRRVFTNYLKNAKPEMEVYNVGISDIMGTFELTHRGELEDTGGGSIYADYGDEVVHREQVMTVTLNQLYDAGVLDHVDFMKIDCEGAEVAVLRGISDRRLKNIRCVSMELHRTVVSDTEREKIVQRLTRLGFKHFAMFYADVLITYNFWKE